MVFKCVMCGGEFESGWTEEESHAELVSTFGDIPSDDCVLVCDDCYQKVNPIDFPERVADTVAFYTEPEPTLPIEYLMGFVEQ